MDSESTLSDQSFHGVEEVAGSGLLKGSGKSQVM